MTQSELTSLIHLKVWGNAERFHSNVTFLLVLAKEGVAEDRVYRLARVWVHLYQARVSTLDSTAEQLTQLASTRPNWPYALVQLSGDTHQVPLPKEGHLSILAKEHTSHVPYGRIQQLEVYQLLSSGSQVVYPEGLNGCQVPVITHLPESLSQGVTMLKGESTFPQRCKSLRPLPKVVVWALLLLTAPSRSIPLKAEGQISMTMEVSKLLSWAALDTSGIASRISTPKRPGSLALATLLPLKLEDSTRLVDTSLQVSAPEDMEMDKPTLEEIHISPPPVVNTLRPSGEAPSVNVAQLQEEANKALDYLLAARSSLDARWRRHISDFSMALHQIESETTKAINEARALCVCTTWDVETHQVALISEPKVWHTSCLKGIEDKCSLALAEVENCYSTTIREAESNGTSRACSAQQSHAKDIQHLEAEAIEEEGKDHLAFLTTCGAALRASPPKGHGIMVTPYHLLLGNAPISTLLSIPLGVSPPEWESAPQIPSSTTPAVTGPLPWSKWWHHSPVRWGPFPIWGYFQSNLWVATSFQAEGGNASPQGPVKESPGGL